MLPKIHKTKYIKVFDDAKTLHFLVKDEELLVKYNEMWVKIKSIIKRKIFHTDSVFDNKYLKTKINLYKDKITTNFNGKVSKEASEYICLSLIEIDSVFKLGKNYFRQIFLEECKCKIKKRKNHLLLVT